MKQLGLYIHIPFCLRKCYYCDFPSFDHLEELRETYLAALRQEMLEQSRFFTEWQVNTVYIGGGTPTCLRARELGELCEGVSSSFQLTNDVEWSIEANPGTLNQEKLQILRDKGVNRISIGIQALQNPLLKLLGRIHDAHTALDTLKMAKQSGFKQISADLMTGLPQQTLSDLQESVSQLLVYVSHLSVYGLKIEAGTQFAAWEAQGQISLPDEATEDALDQWLLDYLEQQGYGRYEISNFAPLGNACRHNLKYWNYQPYLGLGSGAHSFLRPQRRANFADPRAYINALTAHSSPVAYNETLSESVQKSEFMFLGLRTAQGVTDSDYNYLFHCSLEADYGPIIESFIKQGLMEQVNERYCLTRTGMKYGNQLFAAFLS